MKNILRQVLAYIDYFALRLYTCYVNVAWEFLPDPFIEQTDYRSLTHKLIVFA